MDSSVCGPVDVRRPYYARTRCARWLAWVGGVVLLAAMSAGPARCADAAPEAWWQRWLDPTRAPFIPVPEIDVDPNAGTTLGILPVWIRSDEHGVIRRIVAPDIIYDPNFGWGARGRIFGFPSADTQWSVVGGGKQRVEREFDAQYEFGRLRRAAWSWRAEAIFDRSGTPRFYGIGNRSLAIDQTNYTNQQHSLQTTVGRNFGPRWQLGYTLRLRSVDVTPGSLVKIISIERRFARLLGVGTNHELLNRVFLSYDTRDDPGMPRSGYAVVAYGGLADRYGFGNGLLYEEAGLDARGFRPIGKHAVLAAHASLRILPATRAVPFWALSSIGGGSSVVGGVQPLRGYGDSRFYDRNAFSASVELRQTVFSFSAGGTPVDIELTPFVDLGHVYASPRTSPLAQLHVVGGLGVRAVARPTVVGFVDLGYGSEGLAAFTGINYPF
jgi:hypothetical protein